MPSDESKFAEGRVARLDIYDSPAFYSPKMKLSEVRVLLSQGIESTQMKQ